MPTTGHVWLRKPHLVLVLASKPLSFPGVARRFIFVVRPFVPVLADSEDSLTVQGLPLTRGCRHRLGRHR